MVSHTPRALAEKYILKIVGPIIRISNYPLLQRQKIRIMELLIKIRNLKFKLDAYNNQMLSVCLRLLQEFKSSDEIIQIVSETYYSIIDNTVLKKDIVTAILNKLKTIGGNLMQTVYFLVKKIIKERMELPKTVFEKIHEEINSILLNTS
jgi:division protein CdvB (Snf7/Vps24/ESCRT-III family)